MWTFISHFRDDPPDGHETGRHADEEEEEVKIKIIAAADRFCWQLVQVIQSCDLFLFYVFMFCRHTDRERITV